MGKIRELYFYRYKIGSEGKNGRNRLPFCPHFVQIRVQTIDLSGQYVIILPVLRGETSGTWKWRSEDCEEGTSAVDL